MNYPELWALLLKWDLDSRTYFRPGKVTVHDIERRFQLEDQGIALSHNGKFRWENVKNGQMTIFDK